MCRSVCAWRPFSAYWRVGGVRACQFPLHRLARARRRPTHSHTCCTTLIHYQPRPPPAPPLPPPPPFTECTLTPFANLQLHHRQPFTFQQFCDLSTSPFHARIYRDHSTFPPHGSSFTAAPTSFQIVSNDSGLPPAVERPPIGEVPLHPNLHQHLPRSPHTTPVFFGSLLPRELLIGPCIQDDWYRLQDLETSFFPSNFKVNHNIGTFLV